jgi:protein-L-isoaspartate(D-aspartate) O-methyltransferase
MRNQGSLPSNPNFADANFALRRRIMVDRQIRTFDVTDRAVIARMLEVPRELFLPADLAPLAYCDGQLQVAGSVPGEVRTLVAPFALARLIQAGTVAPDDKVLVVGDGPGYAAALIAGLTRRVVALESDPGFAERTREACASLGIGNVSAITGPLASGYPPTSPYDVVFVLGVVEVEPEELYAQLSDHGRLMTFQKPPRDPAGRAAKAVRITHVGSEYCARPLFDAAAPVLDAFRAKPVFVF